VSASVEANVGAGAVRDGYRFDEAALARWMTAHVADFAGPLTVEQFHGGQSNPTYRLTTPDRRYVLRRKPPGPILNGAHAIERVARVLSALGAQGFPVPHVQALCTDDAVIGTAFYVMDLVEGRIFWDAALPEVSRVERAALYDAMNATIAQLHRHDPQAIGLGDYGRPGNYFARQITRWSDQYRADTDAGRYPAMDRLVEWLPAHLPVDDAAASVVHGDFRIDNMIFHPTEPRVVAVLDWELSTLGHPLADFAYHAMMYRMPPQVVAGLGGSDPAALGLPGEADYIAAYCRRTARTDIPDFEFYLAFNFFRLAAIFHGIKGRVVRGNASSASAAERIPHIETLADIAWSIARRIG